MNNQTEILRRNWRNNIYSAWDIVLIKIAFFISTFRSRISLSIQGCSFGRNFRTSGICSFKARTFGSIRIGHNVTFLAHFRTNRVGMTGPVILQTLEKGEILIGDGSGGSSVVISARSNVTIGLNCKIGGNVRIFDHDFHSMNANLRRDDHDQRNVRSRPVSIGNDVFIGTGAIILKGVKIGDRSVIGAGSVISFNVPADSVVTWSRDAFHVRRFSEGTREQA